MKAERSTREISRHASDTRRDHSRKHGYHHTYDHDHGHNHKGRHTKNKRDSESRSRSRSRSRSGSESHAGGHGHSHRQRGERTETYSHNPYYPFYYPFPRCGCSYYPPYYPRMYMSNPWTAKQSAEQSSSYSAFSTTSKHNRISPISSSSDQPSDYQAAYADYYRQMMAQAAEYWKTKGEMVELFS